MRRYKHVLTLLVTLLIAFYAPALWATEASEEALDQSLEELKKDLDVIFYSEGELDLSSAIRDELALALPMAPVCKEDCAGLCPTCGNPKSGGSCTCVQKETDPRWAELAKLKIQ